MRKTLLALVASLIVAIVFLLLVWVSRTWASTTTNITYTSAADWNTGTSTDTVVSGSGDAGLIQLETGSFLMGSDRAIPITIDNTASVNGINNYQVQVTINTAALVAATDLQADCGDVLFVDSDQETLLSFYQHDTCNTAATKFTVKVPVVTASSTKTIYMFYGGTNETSLSSGADTFLYFNDFSSVPTINLLVTGTGNGTTHVHYMDIPDYALLNSKLEYDITFSNITTAEYGDSPFVGVRNVNPGTLQTTVLGHYVNTYNSGGPGDLLRMGDGGASGFGVVAGTQGYHLIHRLNSTMQSTVTNLSGTVLGTSSGSYTTSGTAFSFQLAGFFYGVNSGSYVTHNAGAQRIDFYTRRRLSSGVYGGGTTGYLDNVHVSRDTETPPSVSVGSATVLAATLGTWESPLDANVIDLVWSEAWGDGATAGSTAFEAVVTGATVDNTVTFSIRTADSVANLSAASYVELGEHASAGTFTVTKGQMEGLGVATGASGRYLQIKATLSGQVSPQLESFTLTYQLDSTEPNAASNIVMLRQLGGDTIAEGEWSNSLAPVFSWTAATDAASGVAGYCLYVGTDAAANPEITKGLLGTGPAAESGDICPFATTSTSIDFADAAYRGATWLSTSNNSYSLLVTPYDNVGNVRSTAIEFTFYFDSTAPIAPTYLSLPSGFVQSKAVTLTWPTDGANSASDSNSGLVGLQYRIGAGGTWYGSNHTGTQDATDVILANTGTYTFQEVPDFDDLQEGVNIIYVRALDEAGNASSNVTATLGINSVAPSAPTNLAVDPADNTTNSYAFSWDLPNIYVGNASDLDYCYSINTTPNTNTCNWITDGSRVLDADAYATSPGTNTLYVVARDGANNISYSDYASIEFRYNGSAPGIARGLELSDISIKSTSSWKLALSWAEPSDIGAGVTSYQIFRASGVKSCSQDFSLFSQVGSTAGTSYSDTALSQVEYSYCVKACDSANSCSAVSSSVSGYPDGRYTEAANLTAGPATSSITTKRAVVTWSTARQSDSRVAFGTSSDDFEDEEPSKSEQTTDHSIQLSNLSPGTTYYYRAKWIDEDGNLGTSEVKSFKTAPAPVIKDVKVSYIGIDAAIIEFVAQDASTVKLYSGTTTDFGSVKSLTTVNNDTTTVQLTDLLDGQKYYFRLDAVDAENEEYQGTVLDFTTVERPRITLAQVQEVPGMPQPTLAVTWQTNTAISSIVEYQPLDATVATQTILDSERLSGDHQIYITGLRSDSLYSIVISGRDEKGNLALSDPLQVRTGTDNRPPTISNVLVESVYQSTSGTGLNNAQLIVSWNTDEPATSQIEYGEGSVSEYSQRTQSDAKLKTNHVVVASGLTPSQVIHLRALSVDAAGNQSVSPEAVTITAQKQNRAIDLVLSNISERFSFFRPQE